MVVRHHEAHGFVFECIAEEDAEVDGCGSEASHGDALPSEDLAPIAEENGPDMGNLLVHVRGEKPEEPGKKLMLAAHMDEVGIIITDITGEGYLKFDFVGGVDRRVVIGKKVLVGDQAIPGVIGLKAIHQTSAGERDKVPALRELSVDIGVDSREEAEKLVSLGDVGTFDDSITEFGEGYLKAKAIDDRVGCADGHPYRKRTHVVG